MKLFIRTSFTYRCHPSFTPPCTVRLNKGCVCLKKQVLLVGSTAVGKAYRENGLLAGTRHAIQPPQRKNVRSLNPSRTARMHPGRRLQSTAYWLAACPSLKQWMTLSTTAHVLSCFAATHTRNHKRRRAIYYSAYFPSCCSFLTFFTPDCWCRELNPCRP